MKKISTGLIFFLIAVSSCSSDEDISIKKVAVTLQFSHYWDETPISNEAYTSESFITQFGQTLSIERLRYLLSKIRVEDHYFLTDGDSIHLINPIENKGLEISFPEVYIGSRQIAFTFGLSNSDNLDGIYPSLNSANFNVPLALGGGYHFMQMDGKYKTTSNEEAPFNFHAIRAVNASDPSNLIFEDTSFEIDLGELTITTDTIIPIKVNLAAWFKNPNTWNLNELNTMLMPNAEAQKLISENGASVFSILELSD